MFRINTHNLCEINTPFHTLCVGEEETLSDDEIAEINMHLEAALAHIQAVQFKFKAAEHRFRER